MESKVSGGAQRMSAVTALHELADRYEIEARQLRALARLCIGTLTPEADEVLWRLVVTRPRP